MCRMKLSKGILPLLLVIALLFPQSAFAAVPGIPDFDGAAVTELNRNVPALVSEDNDMREHITYSSLDALGRPGPVTACLSSASLPTGLRSDDVGAMPVGWVTVRYEDGYLYSLCHLLSPALGGDASAAENVFTGTRYLQNESMRPFEDRIADCLARTAYHVLCRVTPVYSGDNLVPDGVQLEALSVEDGGRTVCFNVFLYNIRPGVAIDYRSGESVQDASVAVEFTAKDLLALRLFPEPSQMLAPQHASFAALSQEYQKNDPAASSQTQATFIPTIVYIPNSGDSDQHYHATDTCSGMSSPAARSFDSVKTKYEPCPKCWSETEYRYLMSIYEGTTAAPSNSPVIINTDSPTYILNTKTMIIHDPSCAEISKMNEENKLDFYGTYDQISSDYTPCGHCNPTAKASNTMTVSQTASPTPRPVITPAPTEKPKSDGNSLLSGILSSALSTDNTMVWISNMDHCYHSTDSCTNVDSAGAYQKTLDWAKAIGYQACRNCW